MREQGISEKKKKIDLATFAELAQRIELACTRIEAREAFAMGRQVIFREDERRASGTLDASMETKKRMIELIKPKEELLQVRSVRMISKGGVLEAGKLMERKALKDGGWAVLPKFHAVPTDISEVEVLYPTLRPSNEISPTGVEHWVPAVQGPH